MRIALFQFSLILAITLFANAFVPEDLSNFQNEYVCDANVRLVRPRTQSDVEEAVKRHTRVKAVGTGNSWNEFLCATPPEDFEEGSSANIVMTTIRPLNIEVSETEMSAWVSAGVEIWDLMEFLGHYITPSAPSGYALGSTPQYVNQTIAGAIATGTHGSSLTHSSLSNQVIGFRVVLANGTTTEIYPDNYPLYFKAFQVNVGRLGVVTDVKMRIIKENLIRRRFFVGIPEENIIPRLQEAQEMYKSTRALPEWLDGRLFAWNPVDYTFLMYELREADSEMTPASEASDEVDIDDLDEEPHEFLESLLMDRVNDPFDLSRNEEGRDIADGVSWEDPTPLPPNLVIAAANSTPLIVGSSINSFATLVGNDTLDTHRAAINFPPAEAEAFRVILHDDYGVAIPVDKMADCLEGAIALLKSQAPDTGLRTWLNIRFIGKETGLLSAASDEPRLWISAPDYVYYNQEVRQSNEPFKNLIGYLVSSPLCSPARLHWGKGGWPDPGCWNGADVYPNTWCDFGCAVRYLDPEGKFLGNTPGVWYWGGANLDECCTADGYDKSRFGCDCAVVRQRTPDECPQAPFYSTR